MAAGSFVRIMTICGFCALLASARAPKRLTSATDFLNWGVAVGEDWFLGVLSLINYWKREKEPQVPLLRKNHPNGAMREPLMRFAHRPLRVTSRFVRESRRRDSARYGY
jgi:hypothetical protein